MLKIANAGFSISFSTIEGVTSEVTTVQLDGYWIVNPKVGSWYVEKPLVCSICCYYCSGALVLAVDDWLLLAVAPLDTLLLLLLSVDSEGKEGEEGINGSCEYTLIGILVINAVDVINIKTANTASVWLVVPWHRKSCI